MQGSCRKRRYLDSRRKRETDSRRGRDEFDFIQKTGAAAADCETEFHLLVDEMRLRELVLLHTSKKVGLGNVFGNDDRQNSKSLRYRAWNTSRHYSAQGGQS